MAKPNIEQVVRDHIVRGVFPPDTQLRMEDLKARFEVGYSPIREALSRLIGEGLVEFEPNRGFRVKALSKADLEDIAISRIAVETTALRRSMELGDDRWEANVVAALYHYRRKAESAYQGEEGLAAWEQAHDELHAALIAACASPRLLAMQKQLQDQHLRYRRLIVVPQVGPDAHIAEHERLVGLVLDRKADEALSQIEHHMRITVDALQEAHFWEEGG